MIRVGIVDDHAIVRNGLRQFLTDHVDLRVTGEANNGREALELARSGEVDVMLMDISMPDHSGIDALAAIKARIPDLAVPSCRQPYRLPTTALGIGWPSCRCGPSPGPRRHRSCGPRQARSTSV